MKQFSRPVALVPLFAALAFPLAGRAQTDAEAGQRRLDFGEVVKQATARVFPAVVYIKCVRETHEGGKRQTHEVTGSGVIVSETGEVVTNWHVVDKAIEVRCLLSDGRALHGAVVGTDQITDLGLIQLDLSEESGALPVAEFGDSSLLQEGDFVMAMGAPYGLNRSVSIGIVSCTRRYLPDISEYSLWLQTDSPINPGNSGGPLVNTEGRIIGINTRGGGGDGMGFAIPSETVDMLLTQLRDYGKMNWSWTGVQLQPLRDFNRDMYFDATEGVIVAETDPESPARRAGLQPRDRIVRINGEVITALTEEDLPAVRRVIGLLPKHEVATLDVIRDGEPLALEMTPREKGEVEGEELDCPRWDLTVKEINQFDNPNLYFYRKEGVFIYGIRYPGNAGGSGLRTNDIITKIDGEAVTSLDDVKNIHKKAIANVKNKHRIVFEVMRNGLLRQVVLDFQRDFEKD